MMNNNSQRPPFSTFRRSGVFALLAFIAIHLSGLALFAAPSGGPYGPIHQSWPLPTDAARVHYVSPDGDAEASGDTLQEPTTLSAAISKATSGDAIILRGGTYRTGNLVFNQGITLQPYLDEIPLLKGTRVATEWQDLGNGLWRTKWEELFPAEPADWWRRFRHGKTTALWMFNNDMIFVDGSPLRPVGWEGNVDAHTYHIDYGDSYVYIGVNPEGRMIEITAFDNALTRITGECHGRASDRKGPIIRGITFTQYAYRAIEIEGHNPEGISPETDHGKDVVGTVLEHLTITHCSRVAAYLRGDHMTIRHCLISDTKTEGLFILSSNDVMIERNILRRNNLQKVEGYYPAALKIFNQCYRVTCNDNYVTEQPNSSGIWYDVGNREGVFTNNWIENSNDGFFFEISTDAYCVGNLFINCNRGIRILNADGVYMAHNTLINSVVDIERTPRSAVDDHFGWHPATGPDVHQRDRHTFINNLMYADETFKGPLLNVLQTASLCDRLTKPQVSSSGGNLFVRVSSENHPLIVWSPDSAATEGCNQRYVDLSAFQNAHPAFEQGSRQDTRTFTHLFMGKHTGRYSLHSEGLAAKHPVSPVDADLMEKIGVPAYGAHPVGAYPVKSTH